MPDYSYTADIETEAEAQSMSARAVRYVKRHPEGSTATQIASALSVRLSSLSSALVRLVDAGKLRRVPGVGPHGGFGYFPVPKVVPPIERIERVAIRRTAWDHIGGSER